MTARNWTPMDPGRARKLLGLGTTYTEDELRAAHRKFARVFHPDRATAADFMGPPERTRPRDDGGRRMQALNDAVRTLRETPQGAADWVDQFTRSRTGTGPFARWTWPPPGNTQARAEEIREAMRKAREAYRRGYTAKGAQPGWGEPPGPGEGPRTSYAGEAQEDASEEEPWRPPKGWREQAEFLETAFYRTCRLPGRTTLYAYRVGKRDGLWGWRMKWKHDDDDGMAFDGGGRDGFPTPGAAARDADRNWASFKASFGFD